MSLYDELPSVVSGIMEDFKQGSINLIQFEQSGNPDEPTSVEKIKPLKGTVSGVSYKYLKESFSTISDKEVATAVLDDTTPTVDDFLEIDGLRYKILEFLPLPSAGKACVWKFIVRKG